MIEPRNEPPTAEPDPALEVLGVPIARAAAVVARRRRQARKKRSSAFDVIDRIAVALLARCPAAADTRCLLVTDQLEAFWTADDFRIDHPSASHRLDDPEVLEATYRTDGVFDVLVGLGLVERRNGGYWLAPLIDAAPAGGRG